ncbi:MAG: aminotransferase class V-fold PLP-dependent enzyme, partial [Vicinamibacterales bacterium]
MGTTNRFRKILDAGRTLATRRQLLQGSAVAAFGALLPGQLLALAGQEGGNTTRPQRNQKSIYDRLGVKTLINARGTVTIVGASRTLPEVKQAMEAAARDYVQIDELMESVGRRLAELTGADWGIVTSGASAALTVAAAGCIAGGDPDRMVQLPDLTGLKDEVIMPGYSRTAYDHAVKVVGAKVIEVANRDELEAALGPRTALVMVLAGRASQEGPLSLSVISSLARPRRVPVLVDAAADEIVVPNPYLALGADLVAYSGGKCLRGPQCAGLLLGRKDLTQAAWINSAPHHGLGRGFKVGREEIMGMLAAVEAWVFQRDHAAEQRRWRSWLEHIAQKLRPIPGVMTEIAEPQGLSNRTPSLRVSWDMTKIPLTGFDVENLLWDGELRIAIGGAGSFLPFPPPMEPEIRITPYQLEAGEERVIASALHAVLSRPPKVAHRTDAPVADLTGQWDVEIKYVASTAHHAFAIEQKGSDLVGTHYGSFADRNLAGTLHGTDLAVRSSYTQQGV